MKEALALIKNSQLLEQRERYLKQLKILKMQEEALVRKVDQIRRLIIEGRELAEENES